MTVKDGVAETSLQLRVRIAYAFVTNVWVDPSVVIATATSDAVLGFLSRLGRETEWTGRLPIRNRRSSGTPTTLQAHDSYRTSSRAVTFRWKI